MQTVTVAEAAKTLGVQPRTIHKYFQRKLLRRATKSGKLTRITRAELDRFTAARRGPGKPPQS